MIKIKGYYFDGRSSNQLAVSITFELSGEVLIEGVDFKISTSIKKLKISPRLANTRRSIYLTGGAKLETDDNKAIDKVQAYFSENIFYSLLHKVEKNSSIVFLSLFISIIFIWGGIEYGVPFASKWVVKTVPYQAEKDIGEQGLEALDQWLFSKSTLTEAEQAHWQQQFGQLLAVVEKPYDYRLILKHSKKMGANALALPGGIIVVTDALIELAENDQQVLAVIAHEMGHIEYQHGLRALLQNSMTALFMAGILGDITSISSLSVTLPTLMVEQRYSREFELEADQYAVEVLQQLQINIEQYIRILSVLKHAKHMPDTFDYFSTHPSMDKRIEIIQK